MSSNEMNDVTERLFTTYPKCQQDVAPPTVCVNSVAREPASEDEIKVKRDVIKMEYQCKQMLFRFQEIYEKLHKTHTISSGGGTPRRPPEEPKAPGYGQKCFPIIEGIEERFKAEKPVPKETYSEQVTTLL